MSKVFSPFGGMIMLVGLYLTDGVVMTYFGEYTSLGTDYVWHFSFSLALAWWVGGDTRIKKVSAPYEFEAAVFFAWPIVAPWYLFKTRGVSALVPVITLIAMYLLPEMVSHIAYYLVWD